MQIGHGRYEPKHWPHFRFAPSLAPYYDQATLVIAHGGLATTMEVLKRGLPLVGVSNHDRADNHQDDLLNAMEAEGFLVWCRDLGRLEQAIHTALTVPRKHYQVDECQIHLRIHEFLAATA
jgi:UDP-N-acetylglucosamine transferase subunit ALG13